MGWVTPGLCLFLFAAFMTVAKWDYEDARRQDCAVKQQYYDLKKDKCYGKTQENRSAS